MHKDFWGYIGASAGRSDFRTDCPDLFDCEKHDTGWKLYGGGTWNEVWGLEAGDSEFGKTNAGGGDVKAWAGNLSLTAGVPIGDRFRIFAKGGGTSSKTPTSMRLAFEPLPHRQEDRLGLHVRPGRGTRHHADCPSPAGLGSLQHGLRQWHARRGSRLVGPPGEVLTNLHEEET